MKMKDSFFAAIIGLLTILILVPGFYQNRWRAAGRDRFVEWRRHRETFVIARIVESRKSGLFSYGGMLGFGCAESNVCTRDIFTLEDMENEYVVYNNGGVFQSYDPYTSHPGLQGVIFSFLEHISVFDFKENLNLFHGGESLLSAMVFGLFFYWVYMEMGIFATIVSILSVATSEWMTFYGGNIFWNLWSFYLPFVFSSLFLTRRDPDNIRFGFTLYALIVVKCLFTGFEFITPAMLMPLVPFVYYAIRNRWTIALFISRIFKASIWILSGVFTTLLILLLQIWSVKPTFFSALDTIAYALGKRTYGDPTIFVEEADSLKSGFLSVLIPFIKGRAIRLGDVFNLQTKIEISYQSLFIVFFGVTIVLMLLLVMAKKRMTQKKNICYSSRNNNSLDIPWSTSFLVRDL